MNKITIISTIPGKPRPNSSCSSVYMAVWLPLGSGWNHLPCFRASEEKAEVTGSCQACRCQCANPPKWTSHIPWDCQVCQIQLRRYTESIGDRKPGQPRAKRVWSNEKAFGWWHWMQQVQSSAMAEKLPHSLLLQSWLLNSVQNKEMLKQQNS